MEIEAVLLGVTLVLGGSTEPRPIDPADFRAWFEAASHGRLRIPESVERRAQGFRYVFVAGLRNESMPNYFAQNTAELRARGVPRRSIHRIAPSSDRSVEENLESVRDEFLRIADEGPERLVVIAHSRGACDALAFALRDPDFVRDRVEALFLVQGPFGGTGLADYVLGEGPALDGRMPPIARGLAWVLAGLERSLVARGRHGGLAALTRDASTSYWRRALEEHADAIPTVGPKVYYVESECAPSHLGLFRRATARYLGAYYGPNDGVVAVADQSLPGLGTRLGCLGAGHADLTRSGLATQAGRRTRRALVASILMAVGHSDDDPSEAAEPRPHGRRSDRRSRPR
jgi:pimeloyl-ACP methyl ester carboxylesterase